MAEVNKSGLKKEIGLLGVYAIATGATLSAGFFLLPGLAAVEAGSAIVLAYLVAAISLVPAVFSIIELATAMPRAGGMARDGFPVMGIVLIGFDQLYLSWPRGVCGLRA